MDGPGFYTRTGRAGAGGTGLTIRFRVDPEAREGEDFTVNDDYVRVLNRAALRVVPESLDLTFPGYLELLASGGFDPTGADRGVWMKLQRRLRIRPLSPEDEARAVTVATEAVLRRGRRLPKAFLSEWLRHPIARKHPQVLDRLRETVGRALDQPLEGTELLPLLKVWFSDPISDEYPELKERWVGMAERMVRIYGYGPPYIHGQERAGQILAGWFSLPLSTEHPELVQALLDADRLHLVQSRVFPQRPEWPDHPELLRTLMERTSDRHDLVLHVLSRPQWARHPELLHDYFDHSTGALDWSVAYVLHRGASWFDQPELVRALIDRASWGALQREGPSEGRPRTPEEWAQRQAPILGSVAIALSRPEFRDHPELVRALLDALPPSYPEGPPGLVPEAESVRYLLDAAQWSGNPELILAWIEQADRSWDGWLTKVLQGGAWQEDPALRALCGGEAVEVGCLRQALQGRSEIDLGRAGEIAGSLGSLAAAQAECR